MRRIGLIGGMSWESNQLVAQRLGGLHSADVVLRSIDLHRVIYEELRRGIIDETSRRRFQEVIGRLVDAGASGVILGCTEIELLVDQGDSPVPVFPTTRIHASAAVDAALAPRSPADG